MEMGETERASFPGSLAKATVRGGRCGPRYQMQLIDQVQ